MGIPRREFVHPDTAQAVTLSAYQGQLLTASRDARTWKSRKWGSDEALIAASSAVPLHGSAAQAVAVESDRYLEQGFVQLSAARPLAAVLAHHQPFLTWNSVAADLNRLAGWWGDAWAAPRPMVETLCERCTGVTVNAERLLLSFGARQLGVELPLAVDLRPMSPFVRAFGAAHAFIWGNNLTAGALSHLQESNSDEWVRELLGFSPPRLESFIHDDDQLFWLAGDASNAEQVYRVGTELVLVEQSPEWVVCDAMLRNVVAGLS